MVTNKQLKIVPVLSFFYYNSRFKLIKFKLNIMYETEI